MISVIIPVYNSSDTILSSLESVKNQSYKELEIIIVNDGSTDDSLQLIEQFIERNKGLNFVLINQYNQGVSKARNAGMEKANGDWIALLDSDDKWLSNKLERQLQVLLENPHIDFLGTNRNDEILKDFLHIKIGKLTKLSAKDLLYKMFFVTSTVIFKKEILTEIGFFDEKQKYCEDANYFIKIARKKEAYLLNESLIVFGGDKAFFGEKGLSSNLWEMQKGEIKNLKYALNSNVVNYIEYCSLYLFLMLKYFRRVLLVKKKRLFFYN
jgi:glycosyltransferase involved in cell wall biosynthesis